MVASSTITVVGIKDAMRELQKIEHDLAKQIKKDFKDVVKPVVNDAKLQVVNLPLSGFKRNWKAGKLLPWSQTAVSRSIIARYSNRRRGNSLAVFSVTMKSPAGTIFDIAGRISANRLGSALDLLYGRASRLMWPTYERHANQVNKNMADLVEKITDATNRRLLD